MNQEGTCGTRMTGRIALRACCWTRAVCASRARILAASCTRGCVWLLGGGETRAAAAASNAVAPESTCVVSAVRAASTMAPRPDGSRSDGISRGLTAAGAGVPPPPHAVGASAVTAAGIFARCDSGRQKLKNIFSCASCRRRERPHRGSSGARLGHRAGCAGAQKLRCCHSAHTPANVRH